MIEQDRINQNRILIGNSNTFNREGVPFESSQELIASVIKDLEVVVVPYAMSDMAAALEEVLSIFKRLGARSVISTHQHPGEEQKMLDNAGVIYINGGNTGRLLANLHGLKNPDGRLIDQRLAASQQSLVDQLRAKSAEGTPIIGASAGFSVMSRDVRTTNDMLAAVQYREDGEETLRIDALGLLPDKLSINAHYQDQIKISADERRKILEINPALKMITDHQGESRIERLAQILEMDPQRTILAIREGSSVLVKGMHMEFHGKTGGLILAFGKEPVPVKDGDNLDFLLKVTG